MPRAFSTTGPKSSPTLLLLQKSLGVCGGGRGAGVMSPQQQQLCWSQNRVPTHFCQGRCFRRTEKVEYSKGLGREEPPAPDAL